ncbi:MAG: RNA 2',3'-cyclic phosphodiesterase [Deltaproteobacteria bacterium]|nr:RNA 2',3'-cyclic phosphodiesterase [Deltaproteobacteria bacterium]MBW2016641.1 RNA 2',3'-cyclic phosphodiesterase [Deltaproteobacteria bacterium]MBW2130127.1 RNA 2',3'-cyclic phosphodiesterase [Deltaproteobacteria bacterium]MBW2303749.1 RNA 2',3'-cyclic phosphodiesterase [Deltaproteobacteria bacterium]
MEIRSFLAFELPGEMMAAIDAVAADLRKTPLEARWVRPGNIHLTMVFLGNIPVGDVDPIKEKLRVVCEGYGPFRLSLNGIGCFPNSRRPRVLWIGLRGEGERLSAFRDSLREALEDFGVEREDRPFRPHLTLGRFRRPPGPGSPLEEIFSKYRDLEGPECRLDRLTFFKSTLKPTGAIYSRLAEWPLVGKK